MVGGLLNFIAAAAWGPVPAGGGTPGRAPHAGLADRGCHAAAQVQQPYDRHGMAGRRRFLGPSTIRASFLRTAHRAVWLRPASELGEGAELASLSLPEQRRS
ncbi:hypothetical protein GCM10022224_080600 [Nonomuraea antimicrobica]|uniref:Uncharacterized protein n=1 Tax=Nonomuraea antimicrobica TaxID=561173 RepID=A0ABP7DCP0_9ACTN